MTDLQLRLLTFIREHIAENGVAPTYDQMRAAAGIASKSGVSRHVEALIAQGLLVRTSGGKQNLRLPYPNLAAVPTAVLSAEIARREKTHG